MIRQQLSIPMFFIAVLGSSLPVFAQRNAATALDLANQRVETTRVDTDHARNDLILSQGEVKMAAARVHDAQQAYDTMKLLLDDPRLLDQVSADARASERVADDAAATLAAAQKRLETVNADIARGQQNSNAPTTAPALQTLLARRDAVAKSVDQLKADLDKANQVKQAALDREKQVRTIQFSANGAQGAEQQELFNAQEELRRTTRETADAEQRYREAADIQSAAESARNAAEQQFRLALRDAQPANKQSIPLDENRQRLFHDDELQQQITSPYLNETQRLQLERDVGQQREQFEVEKSRNDALKRADDTRTQAQQKAATGK